MGGLVAHNGGLGENGFVGFVSVCAILFVSGAHEFRETAGTYVELMVQMKECVFRYGLYGSECEGSVWSR